MTKEEKITEILRLQGEVFGTLDSIRELMTAEVMKHCEDALEETDYENADAFHVAYFREDLQEYSKIIPQP